MYLQENPWIRIDWQGLNASKDREMLTNDRFTGYIKDLLEELSRSLGTNMLQFNFLKSEIHAAKPETLSPIMNWH